jgi:hypothetical protein
MATQVAQQVPARARRPAVSAGVPILASKVTVPSVPDWALPRPRITKLIAQGTRWRPLTVVTAPAALRLVTRGPVRLLPSAKALRGAAAARGSGRT